MISLVSLLRPPSPPLQPLGRLPLPTLDPPLTLGCPPLLTLGYPSRPIYQQSPRSRA